MTDLSDAVKERMERAGSILSAFSMHALEVAPTLDPLLSTHDAPFDSTLMFASLKEAIETHKERLLVADLELTAEADDDKQYRDARDAATCGCCRHTLARAIIAYCQPTPSRWRVSEYRALAFVHTLLAADAGS